MSIKRILIGRPLETSREKVERLNKFLGLAIFSSDALSSVAYGPEEVLIGLALGGIALLHYSLPIVLCIVALVAIVSMSYIQTIHAYPSGGGAYIVAKDNLGTTTGLIAGAALLLDYVLTVAVSITAGIAAITSAFPSLHQHTVLLCIAAIGLLVLGNMRGVRESGKIFSIPTYFFIACMYTLIIYGLIKFNFMPHEPHQSYQQLAVAGGVIPIFLLLRAFASGCATLTGIEAIANGVQAFKPPESKNAGLTMIWMAAILGSMVIGVAVLFNQYGIVPVETETGFSRLGKEIFSQNFMYYALQFSTMSILVIAANTPFADFPRLCSVMAADKFMPRQLANRGDRLVFQNGIILLGLLSALLVFIFHGRTHSLIPLYAVGVFTAFTLSQTGMVVHWVKKKGRGWIHNSIVNGLGASTTAVVLSIIAITKFPHGAWVVVVAIPLLVYITFKIHGHYNSVAEQLALDPQHSVKEYKGNIVIVPISGLHMAVLSAIKFAKSLSDEVQAVYVQADPKDTTDLETQWVRYGMGVPLKVIDSPYRSVIQPLLQYISDVEKEHPDSVITVVVPEFVPSRWWHHLLHNQTGLILKSVLLFKKNVVVISIPFHLAK